MFNQSSASFEEKQVFPEIHLAELTSFTTTDEVLLQTHIDFKIELVSSVVMRKRLSSESSSSTLSFTSDIDILTLDSLTVPPWLHLVIGQTK